MKSLNGFCFTMDVDWASDYIIEETVKCFCEYGIPLTIFNTHNSQYLKSVQTEDWLDVQIHPNFVLPSSQGDDIDSIIDYCFSIQPEAYGFRCHRWFSSNDIYETLLKKGIKYESNICTMMEIVNPFKNRAGILSFPVFFEDGAYIYHKGDFDFETSKSLFAQNGLKVIDFHPMHFMLNTPYFNYMRTIKDNFSREKWNSISDEDLHKLAYNGDGIRSFMESLIEFIQKNKIDVFNMEYIYKHSTKLRILL